MFTNQSHLNNERIDDPGYTKWRSTVGPASLDYNAYEAYKQGVKGQINPYDNRIHFPDSSSNGTMLKYPWHENFGMDEYWGRYPKRNPDEDWKNPKYAKQVQEARDEAFGKWFSQYILNAGKDLRPRSIESR